MKDINTVAKIISESDAILIGASNGLSISEGYNIFANNKMFKQQFSKFIQLYDIKNVLDGCFHQYLASKTIALPGDLSRTLGELADVMD